MGEKMKIQSAEREAYLRKGVRQLVPGIPKDAICFVCANVFRQEEFRGVVANCILQARPAGAEPQVRLLAILLRRLSRQAADLLEDYRVRFMPELGWLLLDERGAAVWQVGSGRERREIEPLSGGNVAQLPREHRSSGALFSGNNQWLLKVLMLSGMDPAYWGGPVLPACMRVGDLAAAAHKPQPSVSLFLKKAEQAAVVERQERSAGRVEWVVRNLPSLLEQWAYDLRGRRGAELFVRSLYPDEPVSAVVERMRGADDIVLSGQEAAHLHGLGVSNSRSPLVYVRDLAGALERFDLSMAKREDAGVLTLCVPLAADAVFGGAVMRNGFQVADILQVWLDVRLGLDRGQEQAEHVWTRVLAPFFRSKRWL